MEVNFNFVQGQTLRQSDIVDYRAAYFTAKNNEIIICPVKSS